MIQFRFSAPKAAAAIQRIVQAHPKIDLHASLKGCYFADKSHLNKEHRPIFGATYQAMRFGPVPLQIYEMMKGEAYWLAELEAESYPWTLQGYRLIADGNGQFDEGVLSESDITHLDAGLAQSVEMTFTDRTAATHGPDWQNANMGSIRYEDMIDESDVKPEIIRHLEETGKLLRL